MEYILKEKNGKRISLKQFQTYLLDMMKDIDEICKKNNIEYTLYSGSALGAIRHEGFIPWDDDLDIAMTRENYYKLIRAFEEENSSKYIYQCYESDKKYVVTYPAMKIRKKYTYIKEQNVLLQNKCNECDGFFIDVFIISGVSKNKIYDFITRSINIILSWIIILLENLELNPRILKTIFIWNAKTYDKYNTDSEFVGDDITWVFRSPLKPYIYKRDDIFPFKRVKFEDTYLPVPNNPDAYLRSHFGDDYMQYPPKDKRQGKHIKSLSFKISRKQQLDYTNYKNQKKILKRFSLVGVLIIISSIVMFKEISFLIAGIGTIIFGLALMGLININYLKKTKLD